MIRKLAEQFVDWQIGRQFLKNEDRALYQYGYEVLINQAVNILIAVLIAILLHAYIPVFVFLISYIPLRSFSGGYHARTNGGCTVVSALLILLVCIVVRLIQGTAAEVMMPLAFVISGVLIFRLAPVADRNKPLDEAEVARYGSISRYLWLAEAIAGTALYFVQRGGQAGLTLAMGHVILSIMLCLGVMNNGGWPEA